MKKIIAILVSTAMLLSLGAIVAGAEDDRVFEPAGNAEVAWLTEDQVAQIEFDGDISEWNNFDLEFKTLNWNNLVTWQCRETNENGEEVDNVTAVDWYEEIGEDFAINAYFAADSDYLYVAFYIDDEDFARNNAAGGSYNGDAFQISIDWNRHMENALEQGEDFQNNKNVFYSFSCREEDGEELVIRVQEGFKDRDISQSMSADPEHPDTMGSAGAWENGWCAEFALSWELLYGDFEYKTWASPVDAFDADHPITIGMSVCYINRAETDGPIKWAAGTFNDNVEMTKWEPTGNGLFAVLNWEEGREVNCRGIGIPTEDTKDTDVIIEDESDDESVAESDTEAATTAAETEEDTTKAAETIKAPEKSAGCGSVIASASVLAVMALAAGAVICKKKD